jgi:hypothetical protein
VLGVREAALQAVIADVDANNVKLDEAREAHAAARTALKENLKETIRRRQDVSRSLSSFAVHIHSFLFLLGRSYHALHIDAQRSD